VSGLRAAGFTPIGSKPTLSYDATAILLRLMVHLSSRFPTLAYKLLDGVVKLLSTAGLAMHMRSLALVASHRIQCAVPEGVSMPALHMLRETPSTSIKQRALARWSDVYDLAR
jgi:hypothetical protein